MKYRVHALVIICLTLFLTVVIQIESGGAQYRVHQHKEATVSDADVKDSMRSIVDDAEQDFQYNPNAVEVNLLQTHLPIILINAEEDIPGAPYYEEGNTHRVYTTADDGEDYLTANMRIIDAEDEIHTVKDTPTVASSIHIRIRGNTSRWFDKKSYSVKLVDGKGDSQNKKIMGMEENNDWVLHGPFLDKTLMRNYIAMNMSGELMEYAPDVRFCEVILNGDYQGLYLMMETVSRGIGRADIEKINETKNVTGYIIEIDNKTSLPVTAINSFTKYVSVLRKNSFFDIVYPGTSQLTPDVKEFITEDVSKFEKALYSYDYDDKDYGFQNFVDVGEFVDYFILMEVFLQHDMGNLSTYFYKDINGVYKPCVWDFNNSLENISSINEDDFFMRKFVSVQAPWFQMLIKEESFTDQVISRYRELRKGVLHDEALITYIADTGAYLGSAVDRNFAVWGYSFYPNNMDIRNKLHPDERNPENYDEAIEQMQNTLLDRLSWLDEHIEVLTQYSHESAVKKYNH